MADDIDIDEHDVLDNPLIRSIFPDLTILKKEVLDDYDEESSVIDNSGHQKVQDFCNLNEFHCPLLKVPTLHIAPTKCENLEGDIKETCRYVEQNCDGDINIPSPITNEIILESNQRKYFNKNENGDTKINNEKVVLINLRSYLENCKKYCEICLILFPNEEEFKFHIKSFHNITVSDTYQKVNNSTCDTMKQSEMISQNKLKCNICEKLFASISGLNKHKRNIHFFKTKVITRRTVHEIKIDAVNNANRNNGKMPVYSRKSCFHCTASFSNTQSLIEHLYDTLQTKKHKKNTNKEERIIATNNSKTEVCPKKPKILQKHENIQTIQKRSNFLNSSKKSVYRCPVCSYYFNNNKYGFVHLLKKHKFTTTNSLKKVFFDPKCKFCSSEFRNIERYNSHIQKVHKKFLLNSVNPPLKFSKFTTRVNKTEIVKNDVNVYVNQSLMLQKGYKENMSLISKTTDSSYLSILKSVLFRCNRCDVHFLRSQVATAHSNHMEILVNWKCSVCNRIFKKNDELLHMQQHLVTKEFIVYGICDSLPYIILYNCSKCTVHFEENIFLQHFSVCGTVFYDHIKCKVCGILIDSKLKLIHADHHKKNVISSERYIIIQTEVVDAQIITQHNKEEKDMEVEKYNESPIQDELLKKWLKVYYCNTCKCFVNNGRKFLMHKKSYCTHVVPATCTLCGLIITQTGISSHRRIHARKETLMLQDFKFYDLKNKQLIYPPMPKFPECSVCGIYFGNLITKLRHECGIEEYITCSDCKKNFSALGYKLHMYYHNYRLDKHHIKLKRFPSVASDEKKSFQLEDTTLKKSLNALNNEETVNLIYTCKNCHISVDSYDSMVEHCQEHYNANKTQIFPRLCEICDLIIDGACFKNHTKAHKRDNKKINKIIKFDIYCFMSKYNSWIKRVFESFSKDQVQTIVNKSIYKHENKIKMQVVQEGHYDLTLYKCDQCQCFVDPSSVFKHLNSQCLKLRKYVCSICDISFISVTHKTKHEDIHKNFTIGIKSFKIVLFNRNEDRVFNESLHFENWFTLFKCRNCEGVVNKTDYKNHVCDRKSLKNCIYCGLLLYDKEIDLHILKHKEFSSFNSKNIKVILIGNKSENEDKDSDNSLICSFNGKVYDYIYYRCKKCQICIKDVQTSLKHNCSFRIPSSKCTLCGLSFEARKLKSHYMVHDYDLVADNITLIDFDYTESGNTISNSIIQKSKTNIVNRETETVSYNVGQNLYSLKKTTQKNDVEENTVRLYKCHCGLNFLDSDSLVIHRNVCSTKNRISRQQCSKCGFAFSPNVLFTHLLRHHGNKKKVFKFEIIDKINR